MAHTSRRNIVKGAAWAAPIVIASQTIPAYAASGNFTGLDGWVNIRKVCGEGGTYDHILMDGSGSYPQRGLWVENASASTTVSGASFTVYLPSSFGTLTWRANGPVGGWSVPAVDTSVPPQPSTTAYTTRYTGRWTFNRDNSVMLADGAPNFSSSSAPGDRKCLGAPNFNAYSLRKVTINGSLYEIARGPIRI